MAITEVFTHNQPLGNSDPAHTAYGPRELTASTPAMTPLMLDATSGKLTVWDGAHAGAAMGIGCNRRPEQRGTGILQIWLFPY